MTKKFKFFYPVHHPKTVPPAGALQVSGVVIPGVAKFQSFRLVLQFFSLINIGFIGVTAGHFQAR